MEELYEFDEDSLNEEEVELDEKKKKSGGKKDACYHKVKARYDVWPSAYASGALVKCRKVGAANWGNKSKKKESIEFDDRLLQIIREEYAAVMKEKKKLTAKPRVRRRVALKTGLVVRALPARKAAGLIASTCRKDKKTGKKKCSPCGRSGGEKRSKYPSCRQTPGALWQKGQMGQEI